MLKCVLYTKSMTILLLLALLLHSFPQIARAQSLPVDGLPKIPGQMGGVSSTALDFHMVPLTPPAQTPFSATDYHKLLNLSDAVVTAHPTGYGWTGGFDWQGNWYNTFNFGSNYNYYYYTQYYDWLYATQPQYLLRDINSLGLGWLCLAPGLCESLTGISAATADNTLQAEPEVFTLPPMNGIGGAEGAWDQFEGGQPFPDIYGMDPANPLASGAGASGLEAPIHVQAILGYDPFSANQFGTNYQANLTSLESPWTHYAPWISEQGFGETKESYQQQYEQISQQQLDAVYASSQLSDLRSEYVYAPLYVLYTDPYYLYLEYYLNAYISQIYVNSSGYAELLEAWALMDSWQSVPNDVATLQSRYLVRLYAEWLVAYVEEQVRLYLNQNPSAEQLINQANTSLEQRRQQLYTAVDMNAWVTDWQTRWSSSYAQAINNAQVTTQAEQFLNDTPAMREYLQLNADVTQLLTEFNTHPAATQAANKRVAAFNSADVFSNVNDAYDTYRQTLQTKLGSTNFVAEREWYEEAVTLMAKEHTTYQALLQGTTRLSNDYTLYQQTVVQYLDECIPVYGNACYVSEELLNYMRSDAVLTLLTDIGELYEAYRLFWYAFYRSDAYSQLEETSSTRMATTLDPVKDEINAARTDFIVTVSNIDAVKELRLTSINALKTMRGQSSVVYSAAVHAKFDRLSSELDAKLTRMHELATQLEGVGSTDELIYLPLINR